MIVPAGETVVETKSCRSCGISFGITDWDIAFYDRVSPVFGGQKQSIPAPTLCPDCRQRRRLAFRNEHSLYRDTCALTGRDMVSLYSPDKPHTVYEQSVWWSDGWDAADHGIVFDPTRPFSEHFLRLDVTVPHFSLFQMNLENSDYCNVVANSRDSYLVFASSQLQDCMYGVSIERCQDVVDSLMMKDSSNCYECLMLNDCSDIAYSQRCNNCADGMFLKECDDCRHCLLSSDLKNAEYRIWNKSVTPEEFAREKERIRGLGREEFRALQERYAAWSATIPKKSANLISCESVTGDNLVNCHDVANSFDCYDTERSRNMVFCIFTVSDCADCNYSGHRLNSSYESHLAIFESAKVFFSTQIQNSREVYYSSNCHSCAHIFGCIGLRHKKYCILNKQYTEAEYNELVPRIITHMRETGEWGEFFSPSLSPFGYNETVAMEYFPLTKDEALKQGFNWSDYEPPFPKVDKVIPASKLPESIKDIPDDILNWAIECEVTRKPYRIIKQELEFYRKHNLPIPRRHPDQRHLDRLALRNPRKLHERHCDNCSKSIVTTYAPDRPERVYCQECYEREVYG